MFSLACFYDRDLLAGKRPDRHLAAVKVQEGLMPKKLLPLTPGVFRVVAHLETGLQVHTVREVVVERVSDLLLLLSLLLS